MLIDMRGLRAKLRKETRRLGGKGRGGGGIFGNGDTDSEIG